MIVLRNLLVLLFASLCLVACDSPGTQTTLRIGTNVWPGYEPLYLGRDIGAFDGLNIRLVEYTSASEVIRAFRNRTLELASLTLDEALILIDNGTPVKIILVHDISNGADTIIAKPSIRSVQELRGKRVAVESGALGAYVITRALEMHGLSIADITIKHLDVNAHEEAFNNESVDAVVNFEPVRTRLLQKGASEIFTSKEIYGEIVDVLVIHEDLYEENLSRLKKLARGWFQALDYISTNRLDSATIMAQRLRITPAEVVASFDGLELPGIEKNRELLANNESGLNKTIFNLITVLKDNNLLISNKVSQGNILSDLVVKE